MTAENIWLVLGTAVLNGAVMWGVVKTQLEWLRRDVDLAHKRVDEMYHLLERCAGRRIRQFDREAEES